MSNPGPFLYIVPTDFNDYPGSHDSISGQAGLHLPVRWLHSSKQASKPNSYRQFALLASLRRGGSDRETDQWC
ncbi:hypothetical protein OOU_Y34scaffold00669g94 [Pyricularia oryzae Y34]|uniref:Uncharacterized protein n=1 Tax=Pyricularia oryzae (strain Y34) TaxID=1143189 RepID=A0AA97PIS8_PYRO3|nr:hypothetical protein OOU_Y34scaffold00669g94 [Pyricularia oryzae Y34]